ncbi:hypothetical protein H0H92_001976, partial [Tricholoma furcatifolium]
AALKNLEKDAEQILVLELRGLDLSPGQVDGHCHIEVIRYAIARRILIAFYEEIENSGATKKDYA